MKIDFANLNLAPMPNPKLLNVQRVSVDMVKSETAAPAGGTSSSSGFIRNAKVHPATLTGRR